MLQGTSTPRRMSRTQPINRPGYPSHPPYAPGALSNEKKKYSLLAPAASEWATTTATRHPATWAAATSPPSPASASSHSSASASRSAARTHCRACARRPDRGATRASRRGCSCGSVLGVRRAVEVVSLSFSFKSKSQNLHLSESSSDPAPKTRAPYQHPTARPRPHTRVLRFHSGCAGGGRRGDAAAAP